MISLEHVVGRTLSVALRKTAKRFFVFHGLVTNCGLNSFVDIFSTTYNIMDHLLYADDINGSLPESNSEANAMYQWQKAITDG